MPELYSFITCNQSLATDIRVWQKSMKIFCENQLHLCVYLYKLYVYFIICKLCDIHPSTSKIYNKLYTIYVCVCVSVYIHKYRHTHTHSSFFFFPRELIKHLPANHSAWKSVYERYLKYHYAVLNNSKSPNSLFY